MKSLTLLLLAIASTATAQDQPAASNSTVPVATSPFQPDLTPGYVLIEGDIQVPLHYYQSLLDGSGGGIQATFGGVNYWPANTVPFDFVTGTGGAGDVSAANQTAAVNAMNAIASRAGVIFRPAVGNEDRIRFQNSTGNSSWVGVQGGAQIINIASWGNQIIICHEIYHSLGFWHEQSRTDRTNFVTINVTNICGSPACTQCCLCMDNSGNCISCAFNFNIQNGSIAYGPYDFDSFMHYGRAFFSCGGDTITVNAPWNDEWQSKIGQRDHFSYFDTITCRGLYPFPNDRWVDRAYSGTVNGTFQKPYNNTTLAGALGNVPAGGTLFIKYNETYSAVGTYSTPVTIIAPNGATLGN